MKHKNGDWLTMHNNVTKQHIFTMPRNTKLALTFGANLQ